LCSDIVVPDILSGLWWVCTAKCCICFEHGHLTAYHNRMSLATRYTNLMAKGITADVMHVKRKLLQ